MTAGKKTNRKVRRAAVAKARKSSNGSSNGVVPKLSQKQKEMLAKVNGDATQIERRIAQLALEKDEMLNLLRQKRHELRSLCENAIRGHGIDLDDPDAGSWRVNVETMEVEHIPAQPFG